MELTRHGQTYVAGAALQRYLEKRIDLVAVNDNDAFSEFVIRPGDIDIVEIATCRE